MTNLIQIPNEIDSDNTKAPGYETEQETLLTTINVDDSPIEKNKKNQTTAESTYNIFGKVCASATIAAFVVFTLSEIIIGAMNWNSCEIVSRNIINSGIL